MGWIIFAVIFVIIKFLLGIFSSQGVRISKRHWKVQLNFIDFKFLSHSWMSPRTVPNLLLNVCKELFFRSSHTPRCCQRGIVFNRILRERKSHWILTVAGCVIVTLQGKIARPPRWLITRVEFFVMKWLCTDKEFLLCIVFRSLESKTREKIDNIKWGFTACDLLLSTPFRGDKRSNLLQKS